jgi:hypothetical protein
VRSCLSSAGVAPPAVPTPPASLPVLTPSGRGALWVYLEKEPLCAPIHIGSTDRGARGACPGFVPRDRDFFLILVGNTQYPTPLSPRCTWLSRDGARTSAAGSCGGTARTAAGRRRTRHSAPHAWSWSGAAAASPAPLWWPLYRQRTLQPPPPPPGGASGRWGADVGIASSAGSPRRRPSLRSGRPRPGLTFLGVTPPHHPQTSGHKERPQRGVDVTGCPWVGVGEDVWPRICLSGIRTNKKSPIAPGAVQSTWGSFPSVISLLIRARR